MATTPYVLEFGMGVDLHGNDCTKAARRAVFDLSPIVREEAVNALRGRGYEEAREVFLAAMRHPWAPAADHAAEALVALEDEGAVKELTALLELPDPSMPVKQDNKWTVRQLVRVNHLRNCLLCHAPSTETSDLVRALCCNAGRCHRVSYLFQHRVGDHARRDVVAWLDFDAQRSLCDILAMSETLTIRLPAKRKRNGSDLLPQSKKRSRTMSAMPCASAVNLLCGKNILALRIKLCLLRLMPIFGVPLLSVASARDDLSIGQRTACLGVSPGRSEIWQMGQRVTASSSASSLYL